MADLAKLRTEYSYAANANLVIQPNRSGRGAAEPSGEAESLWGHLQGKRFGDRALPDRAPVVKKAKKEKSGTKLSALEKRGSKKRTPANVLSATEQLEATIYRPKTRDTRLVYEQILNFIQEQLGDQPQDVIRGAADEVLQILKREDVRETDRRKMVDELLTKPLNESSYTKLIQYGKQITDFKADGSAGGIDDEFGVAVVFDEDSDEDELDEIFEDDEGDEEGEEAETADVVHMVTEGSENVQQQSSGIDIHDIDAFWLQRKVSQYIKDPVMARDTAQKVEEVLQEDISTRDAENKLVLVLDYDKFDLIRLLLQNRFRILYAMRLKRAGSDTERLAIEAEMSANPKLLSILNELQGKSEKVKSVAAASGKTAATDKSQRHVSMVDLEAIQFTQGSHFMANKKCELPQGSYRTPKKGYEEVHVPASKSREFGADERLIKISEIPTWAQPGFEGMKTLNRVQSRVYSSAFKNDGNMLLCAPTGAGKTNVAMLTMLHEIGKHIDPSTGLVDLDSFKIVYVAPMKALVQEVVANFSKRLKAFNMKVAELTGDVQMSKSQIAETQVIVTTPEKWDIVTRKSGHRAFTGLVRLIIIDEIHLLHDDRGPVLESLVARTIRQEKATGDLVRIVGLSATLPNYEDVSTFLHVAKENLHYFDGGFRPVPLQQQYIGITEKKAIKRFNIMNQITYEKIMERAGKMQLLVFVHSRKETSKTARAIRDMALQEDKLGRFLPDDSGSRVILQTEAENAKSAELKELLPYGFAIHHAGLQRTDRMLVEDLFADGHIQVLFSTSTLAWGVNLPAHTVIIKGTQVYNPEKGRWCELSPMDVMQMIGRAGRPQYDTEGEGILITSHQELQYYLSLLNQQLPIESQFISKIADHLNAEIVAGTIHNSDDAVNWLGFTYLFVRMMRNPVLYNINADMVEADPQHEQRRADLVHTAASILDKANLINYDRRTGIFQATDLGRVASHYYLTYQSVQTYNEYLKPTMTEIELLRLFSLSSEFKYLTVREEEKVELQRLLDHVPIPVKESMEEPTAKINVLLQAYISKLSLEGFALVSDMVYVTQSAGRIMRALFEIVLKRGWASLALKILQFSKMIDKRMWGVQTPLRQFKNIPEEVLKKIERKEFSWERYFDFTAQELGELVKLPKMGKMLHKLIHQFPRLDLQAHTQPITRSTLRVSINITPDFQMDEQIHGNSEGFWIFIEDADGERILHSEYFILKRKFSMDEHVIECTVPIFDPLPPQYFVHAISDHWLNAESILPISFRKVLLPEKNPPPTELLDLQPLQLGALRSSTFETIYRQEGLSVFNPIQTQVFKTLYDTDLTTLLCAPTGSGKTICAEFAILRALQQENRGKIVYVSPVAAVQQARLSQWLTKFASSPIGVSVASLTGEFTSDTRALEQNDIVLCSPEQWDVLSRRWKRVQAVQAVSLFIVDDLHMIGFTKGPTLEVIVSRMRYIAAQTDNNSLRIVGLSTSVANAKDMGEWIGASSNALFNFPPIARPRPLDIQLQGFDIEHFGTRMAAMARPASTAIHVNSPDKEFKETPPNPAIVFVASRKLASSVAFSLIEESALLRKVGATRVAMEFHVVDSTLKETLRYGVGFLHEGLSAADMAEVSNLASTGELHVVVVPYTLCWSLSFKSHLVIIYGTSFYDGRDHRYTSYLLSDMLQMMGQANSPVFVQSKCLILTQQSQREYYKSFLSERLPIESHLNLSLHDHLNAEIAGSKTIENKQDAVDWITWTFMYRRLSQNPNYYNLQGVSKRHLSDYLSDLVEETISQLEAAKCVVVEDDNDVSAVNLGIIASHYYIRYTTLEVFNSSLKASTKLRGLLEILTNASEYDDIPMRHHENKVLEKLAAHLPLKIDNPKYSNPRTKANILLQAHFARIELPSDLAADQREIVIIASRLLQAMVDVISSNGWLNPALAAMELSQMVSQGLWNKDSPLLQIPNITKEIVTNFSAVGVKSIFELLELDDDKRVAIFGFDSKALAQVARFCNRYPAVELNYDLPDAEQLSVGENATLLVQLEREMDEEQLGPVNAPRFPKAKEEGWWLVLGSDVDNQLLAIKRVNLQKVAKVKLDFAPLSAGEHKYKLYFMCDSYLGCDQEYEVDAIVSEGMDTV